MFRNTLLVNLCVFCWHDTVYSYTVNQQSLKYFISEVKT